MRYDYCAMLALLSSVSHCGDGEMCRAGSHATLVMSRYESLRVFVSRYESS